MKALPSNAKISQKTTTDYQQEPVSWGFTKVFESSFQSYFGPFCVKEFIRATMALEQKFSELFDSK